MARQIRGCRRSSSAAKGGYVTTAITAAGGDAFGWLATQIEGCYPEFEAEQWTVLAAAVAVDVW